MKLEGRITIRISGEGARIEVKDVDSIITFAIIEMSTEQICSALGGLSLTECSIEVHGLDKVGKTHENKSFEFEIPESMMNGGRNNATIGELQSLAQSQLTDGWIAEGYFGSQNSFFNKDGKKYARCTIRRWI